MKKLYSAVAVVAVLAFSYNLLQADDIDDAALRAQAADAMRKGNFKDAYEIFAKLLQHPKNNEQKVGEDLNNAINCLQRLNRNNEVDAIRDKALEVHKHNWRFLSTAAHSFYYGEHYGYIVAGKFSRGHHRGGGEYVYSQDRDRVRALQLMQQAMEKSGAATKQEQAGLYLQFAQMIMNNSRGGFQFQMLTDLKSLPDYGNPYYYGGGSSGAPVEADGVTPVYYKVPKSFNDAKSDGERWRFLLTQAVEFDPNNTNNVRWQLASFLHQQFGVQTMAYYGRFASGGDDDDKDDSGPFAVKSLKDDETIARLATGIKRFKLPDEFNPIKIFRQIADERQTGYGEQALGQLAQIYEDRQQYAKAAEVWQRNIREYGDPHHNTKKNRVDQILGNWGTFESIEPQPAGKAAALSFRFRNGNKVAFEAHPIDTQKLLNDVKAYIRNKPKNVEWEKINIQDIGYRLVTKNENQYLGAQVANWEMDLKPREGHLDRRVTVQTPLQKAGAYLVTGKMANGNTARIVLWLSDTVMVRKFIDKQIFYYVADAVSGTPVADAKLEFFGYRQHWNNNVVNIEFDEFERKSDADGQVFLTDKDIDQNRGNSWLVTASTAEGRLAYMGFTGIWMQHYYDHPYDQTKIFGITDRPVYRPNQQVKFKVWLGLAKYEHEGKSPYAGQAQQIQVINPKGEKVFEKSYVCDEFGGFDGELTLDKSATLGQYAMIILTHGHQQALHFRLEEYKKPEFEVKVDAPSEPVMLGEKITATLNAKYYFGAPVSEGKVKYKVMRTDHSANWYPAGRWDWYYEPGYWWFAPDYYWYPGFGEWGCKRPFRAWMWWGRQMQQPEVVLENEVAIPHDGKLKIEIDTAIAKAMRGNTDHKYEISAEVTDQSRRTIVGSGTVMVARKPFKVYAWVDRGHYKVGDAIEANFTAQTLDNKPVKGAGKAVLYKVTYDKDQKPVETAVQEWPLDTNEEGNARQQLKAAQPGQYRISYKVADAKKHEIEGGYLFCVTGEGFDSSKFRFNDLELITDKREYQPGDKVQLMINTNRDDGTVLLFPRAANNVGLKPQIVRLKGKSVEQVIEVAKRDMPNFFIEALTVANGRVHSEMREIVVPPEKRIVNVEVLPNTKEYKPGEKAKLKIKLTDHTGEPVVGSSAVSVYDKSVEYISGGSNVPEIRSFFWKWRRHHHPHSESSLQRHSYNLLRQNEPGMGYLGAFGALVADLDEELADGAAMNGAPAADAAAEGGFGGGRGELRKMAQKSGAPAAPMAAAPARERAGAKDKADRMELKEAEQQGGQADGKPGADPGGDVQPAVRTNFADTAFWSGTVNTDVTGVAEIDLTMPENLTTWKMKVWTMSTATRVGQGEAEVVTKKNVIVRLQAPRFFQQKDEVVLSANVHNYLKTKKPVKVSLEVNGGVLEAMDAGLERTVEIDSQGEQRVDWRVRVLATGEAAIKVKAVTDEESDAMEMKFPAYIKGMQKQEAFSGNIRPDKESATISFAVPQERIAANSRIEVRYSPTLAGAMVDALPYLSSYPYGCTEQTLSRFLPTVITQKVLQRMNVDIKDVKNKITNLNAQEIGDDKDRAKQWERVKHANKWGADDANPVWDEAQVREMVNAGVERLANMQCADGGWGWFSGWGERSYPHTTAYVVHGLQIAQSNDVKLPPNVLERGVAWLQNYQNEQLARLNLPEGAPFRKHKADNQDAFNYMVLVDANVKNDAMMERLYNDRVDLALYGKAMLGMALAKQKQQEKLDMIMKNIDQFVVQDDENQTAYLKMPENNYWWYWYGSEYEAHAYYLKLLAQVDPKSEKASRLVKYLLNNRKNATYWNSTRDTALCVEAMGDYLRLSGEDKPDLSLEVLLNGKKVKEVTINQSNLFTFDNKFVLSGADVPAGKHTLELRKKGTGPIYFNAYNSNFTLEDNITKTGLEIKVDRKFYRLKSVEKVVEQEGARGQALKTKVEKFEREELKALSELKSGELVEIELEIDSKNDYEYILFEDMKAAGFEPVDVRSGYSGNSLGAYMELRDERVCFFVRMLARGKHSVSYRLRAEIPGKFSALPTRASAMYAPELKANSDEFKVLIKD
ncbi:MAG TPA: MG2 domain-containing protein [Planctomycetota bacterium]|nr:MG2 domain-containing protein [Planctomycetota bacterium]